MEGQGHMAGRTKAAERKRKKPRTLGVTGRGQPYLWYRAGRVGTDGIERGGVWIVMHRGAQVASTDCGLGEGPEREALKRLDDYKASIAIAAVDAVPMTKGRPAHEVSLAEVLSRYLEAKRGTLDPVTGEMKGGISRHHELAQRIETLLLWWG